MIRSLDRGLQILALLNRRDSVSAGDIVEELGFPRATVYRILETLCHRGLVRQHETDKRFRITPLVRTLSDGFTDEDQVARASKQFLKVVTKRLRWPVSHVSISGVDLVVLENTDQMSPLSIEIFSKGHRMPILQTASGICILAHASAARRQIILDLLQATERPQDEAAHDRKSLEQKMRDVRHRGYAVHNRIRKHSDLTAIAVPIFPHEDRVRGAVAVRYSSSAVDLPQAVSRFVPLLQEAADGIANQIKLHLEKLDE